MHLPSQCKEFARFAITGLAASVVLYVSYLLLVHSLSVELAYSLAYVCAFVVNYLLTTSFTFRVRRSMSNGLGFVASNVINYFISMGLLALFLHVGCPEKIAPIPTIALAAMSNYFITRQVMRRL